MPCSAKDDETIIRALSALGPEENYQIIGSHTLQGGLRTVLIAKRAIQAQIRGVASSQIA